jgi:hypothetical protein
MKAYRILPLALAGVLAASFGMAKEKARQSNPARYAPGAQSQERTPDRSIYGYDYMTGHDRDVYYQRLREAKNSQERNQFLAEHYERMQTRAKQYGATLPPPPSMASR